MENKLHRIMPRAALISCMICTLACFALKNSDTAKAKISTTPTASVNAVQEAWERGYENGTKAAKEEIKSKKETKNTEDEEIIRDLSDLLNVKNLKLILFFSNLYIF